MKRLLALVLFFGIIAYIALPTIQRDVKGYINWMQHDNQFASDVQNTVQDHIIPGLQQLMQQLPPPLQNLQVSQLLEQLIDSTQQFTAPVSTNSTQAAGQLIHVEAGDSSVSNQSVTGVQAIVQQLSLPTLQNAISNPFHAPVKIVLYASATTYRQALMDAGVDQQNAHLMTQETGGIAFGNTVYIPVYQTQNHAEMVNILTHELTHVAMNQLGIGNQLPTWLNEGLAWQEGLTAEQKVNAMRVQMEQADVERSIKAAKRQNHLLPLSADEQDILQADYNVEFEDYLAVTYLEHTYGSQKFNQFLNNLHQSRIQLLLNMDSQNPYTKTYQTFQSVFGVSFDTFEQQFMKSL